MNWVLGKREVFHLTEVETAMITIASVLGELSMSSEQWWNISD